MARGVSTFAGGWSQVSPVKHATTKPAKCQLHLCRHAALAPSLSPSHTLIDTYHVCTRLSLSVSFFCLFSYIRSFSLFLEWKRASFCLCLPFFLCFLASRMGEEWDIDFVVFLLYSRRKPSNTSTFICSRENIKRWWIDYLPLVFDVGCCLDNLSFRIYFNEVMVFPISFAQMSLFIFVGLKFFKFW